ncbi:MAG TPA: hypothetical protein VE641_04815 [Chthoniobacterales bacterium]|jgi:hypothetical protein|nr:hypothetical protein [Chthoniobacterales bacterium]
MQCPTLGKIKVRTVLQYLLEPIANAYLPIKIPGLEKILTVLEVDRIVRIWALVNTESPMVMCEFYTTSSGNPVPSGLEYVGTYASQDDVWHVWYRKAQ